MKTGNIADKEIFKYDEYSHGIDYLSFGISDKKIVEQFYTDRIFNLDTDNSNFGAIHFYDDVLSIHKYSSPSGTSYAYSCTYQSISIPIFVITEFSQVQREFCNNQWGIIHFYGAYYRLIELDNFTDGFIDTVNKMFIDCPITRMDYRFDFCSYEDVHKLPDPDDVLPNLRKNKKRQLYFSGPKLQSWDVGNKKNKTIFIRLYNKLDELGGNLKKTYLYSDLDKFKTYFRLEYEFGFKWCAGYTGKSIPDLINKAFSTSGIEESSFNGNLYKPQVALNLSDQIDRLRYMKIYRSMTKNLQHNGMSILEILKDQLKDELDEYVEKVSLGV